MADFVPCDRILQRAYLIFLLTFIRSKGNKTYMIEVKSGKIPVYCHMSELGACRGSGWTLVMKIDGTKVGIQ